MTTPNPPKIEVCGQTVCVELQYPRVNGNANEVTVDMADVRAADGLRIHYDFERDGWAIEQPVWTETDCTGETYREAAFLPSWQFDDSEDEVEPGKFIPCPTATPKSPS